MRKIVLVAVAFAAVVTASPAFAGFDGPEFWGYRHSMQSAGSSELGLPAFRESAHPGCASLDYGCYPAAGRDFGR